MLEILHRVEEALYYPSSENKGADQLCSYCTADLRLCSRISKNPFFSKYLIASTSATLFLSRQLFISNFIIWFVSFADMNHGVLIIETFLIALLARYAYRRREPDIENDIVVNSALDKNGVQIGLDSAKSVNCDDNIAYECTEE